MLARVLLHVIEAANPVDSAIDDRAGRGLQRALQDVEDETILLGDIDDSDAVQSAGVVGLATRGRVEASRVKESRRVAFPGRGREQRRTEVGAVRVIPKQADGRVHGVDLRGSDGEYTTRGGQGKGSRVDERPRAGAPAGMQSSRRRAFPLRGAACLRRWPQVMALSTGARQWLTWPHGELVLVERARAA